MSERLLWLDAPGGAAGDMILAALLDAGAPREPVQQALDALQLAGWRMRTHRTSRCSVAALRVSFEPTAPPQAPPDDRSHAHSHGHGHGHSHSHSHSHSHGEDPVEPDFPGQPERTWRAIRDLLVAADLRPGVRDRALAIFERLAQAEARVHGGDPLDVHFHEVGSVDAILDIVGTCAAIDALGVTAIHGSPLPFGRGWVRCAHGRMPVPAPATMFLMEGWPTVPGVDGVEQVTPTGAAIWVTLASSAAPPAFTVDHVGYGAGKRSLDDRPNVVRAVVGHTTAAQSRTVTTTLAQVDDMPGEHVPPLIAQLLEDGALDVTVTPTVMKKGRPGLRVEAISRPKRASAVARALLQHATTFGVRQWDARRVELDRWHVAASTPFGPVRIKVGALAGDVIQASPEFEDVARCAREHGVPVARVHAAAVHAWHALSPTHRAKP